MSNNDSLSLFKLIWHGLIASWYLGFLAADVAPAAGYGSLGSSHHSGFVPLKLRGISSTLLLQQRYFMLCMLCWGWGAQNFLGTSPDEMRPWLLQTTL